MKKVNKKRKEKKNNKKPKLDHKNLPTKSPYEIINPKFLKFPSLDQEASAEKKSYLINLPFPHVALYNFTDPTFAEKALSELKTEKWFNKRNDLYTFKQTDDLKNSQKPTLHYFREALYSEDFRNYLKYITGITLIPKVDIAGQCYRAGGNLLCHDDELDGRRIAFIWYLVSPDWTESDGGHFCLYGNDSGEPTREPVHRVVPSWNCFLFFETTSTTWHQVSEVLSQEKIRYSISGWFHGESFPQRIPFPVEKPIPVYEVKNLHGGYELKDWISEEYLKPEAFKKIKSHFESTSSIGLNNFLIEEKYNALVIELKVANWQVIGPPNRRHYGTLGRWQSERETGLIKEFKLFLKSTPFISYISHLTGLTIISIGEGEIRKFTKQDYTLVHDNEHEHKSFGLDLHLNFQETNEDWDEEHGGFTTYMDSESELIALQVMPNLFSIVYRDVGCMKFVKFQTSSIPSDRYDFVNTLNTVDDPNSEGSGSGGDNDDDENEQSNHSQASEPEDNPQEEDNNNPDEDPDSVPEENHN